MTGSSIGLQVGGSNAGLRALWSNMNVLFIALFASFVSPDPFAHILILGTELDDQGGLLYGYQQGVLGQALVMPHFQQTFPDIARSSSSQGWLTSILQLGGWAGALSAGVLCEIFSRKHTIFGGAVWVIFGSYLTAGANNSSYLYAGRFFTGIGVGTLSAVG